MHRGCTYGMDLGDVEIENGCFVEEDGSTYCFCDFNRCNAAGILDLRNLIDDKNETFRPFKSLSKSTRHNNQFQSTILKPKESQQTKSANYQKISASGNQNYSAKLSSYFTLPSLYTIASMSKLDNTTKKIDATSSNDRLDRILVNLFGTSKSANSNLIKERIRNSSDPEKLITKFEKYTMALLKNQHEKNLNKFNHTVKNETSVDYTTTSTQSLFTTTTPIPSTPKINTTLSVVSFTQYQNEYEKINATFYKFTLPTTTTTVSNHVNNLMMPSLYKLNINDSFSKNLIESKEFRSRFGLKPKEKLNLLLLKKPATQDGQQDIELLINNQNLNKNVSDTTTIVPITSTLPPTTSIRSTFTKTTIAIESNITIPITSTATSTTASTSTSFTTTSTSTTSSLKNDNILITENKNDNLWLSRLKAKLYSSSSPVLPQQENDLSVPQQQRFQKYPNTDVTDTYKWNYVLGDLYRQSVSQVNFKCPRDGLFSNPINCGQFLQCVYFGTVYERFYILNCPSGLYFNQAIEMCDYPSNVNCPI